MDQPQPPQTPAPSQLTPPQPSAPAQTPSGPKPCKAGRSCTFLRPNLDMENHPHYSKHMADFSHPSMTYEPPADPERSQYGQASYATPKIIVPEPPPLNEGYVTSLLGLGFNREQAKHALYQCGMNVDAAANWLFSYGSQMPQREEKYEAETKETKMTSVPGAAAAPGPSPPKRKAPALRRNVSTRAETQADVIRIMVTEHFGQDSEPICDRPFITSSFALPDLRGFADDFATFVRRDLVHHDAERTLAKLKVINWNPTAPRLYPLNTTAKGNCLVDAACLSLWGIQDSTRGIYVLRHQLYEMLTKYKDNFATRYKGKDIANLVKQANPDQDPNKKGGLEFLEQIHIFALAHVFGRPIIVYADPHYREDDTGKILTDLSGEERMDGIYLPIEPISTACKKAGPRPSPICLAFKNQHFSALVPTAPWEFLGLDWKDLPKTTMWRAAAEQKTDASADVKMETKTDTVVDERLLWYPLMDHEKKELFVHFLKPEEDKTALLNQWFDLITVDGVAGARVPIEALKFSQPLLQEYLEKTAETVSELETAELQEVLGKNKQCSNHCGNKGNFQGLCDDCATLPEIIHIVQTPTGQGQVQGTYKMQSYDHYCRPIYQNQASRYGFFLFHHNHQWMIGEDPHKPQERNLYVTSEAFNVTRVLATWKYFRPGYNDFADTNELRIVAGETEKKVNVDYCPEPKCANTLPCTLHPKARALCKNECKELEGDTNMQGFCPSCFYGSFIVTGLPELQKAVEGEYLFNALGQDKDELPSFKQKNGQFFLYPFNHEWAIGATLYGDGRNIIVGTEAGQLPHQCTRKWLCWVNDRWVEQPTMSVVQNSLLKR